MRIDANTIQAWRGKAERLCAEYNLTLADIKTGREAWGAAHKAGITSEAYAMGRDIHDAHIQTALERIFPNAVFRDAKRY